MTADPYVLTASDAYQTPGRLKSKYDATTAPTSGDDFADGYVVGSMWVDVTGDLAYVCVDASVGAAVWKTTTGGDAPSGADYLVGTANGGLSAEIVVGTSPGGELGGTWGSPTVDTTHSGSSHAGAASAAVSTHEGLSDPHTVYVLEAATPGGELGGTYASPTVDTTHSGSSHAGVIATHEAAGDPHPGYRGELLITSVPAGSPLVFADILQNSEGTALLYAAT